MIADIRLSVDFLQNIKVRKLKKRLGADGVLALIALWSYCAKNFPDGRLGEYSDDVEFIADWDGEDGALASALRELGFLDVCEDGTLELHDWTENNPYVADSRERGDTQRLNRLGGQNPTAARRPRFRTARRDEGAILCRPSYEKLRRGVFVSAKRKNRRAAVGRIGDDGRTVVRRK